MFLLHALILGTLDFLGSVLVDSFKILLSSLSSSLRGIVVFFQYLPNRLMDKNEKLCSFINGRFQ